MNVLKEFLMQVRPPLGNNIDDNQPNPFLEIDCTLGDKRVSLCRAVFVGRTDQFDRAEEGRTAPLTEHQNLRERTKN